MDVVFFNAHDSVVERGAAVDIHCIRVEILVSILQEVDRNDSLLSLSCAMERCQALIGPLAKIGVKLIFEDS